MEASCADDADACMRCVSQMTRNGRSGAATGTVTGAAGEERMTMLTEGGGGEGGGKTPLWYCRVYFKPAWTERTFGGSSRPTTRMRMLHSPRRTRILRL